MDKDISKNSVGCLTRRPIDTSPARGVAHYYLPASTPCPSGVLLYWLVHRRIISVYPLSTHPYISLSPAGSPPLPSPPLPACPTSSDTFLLPKDPGVPTQFATYPKLLQAWKTRWRLPRSVVLALKVAIVAMLLLPIPFLIMV